MIKAEFHPQAEIEMVEAAGYYENQSPGLGKRFLEATHSAVRHIQLNPTIYQRVDSEIRRARVTKFPFGVIFRNPHILTSPPLKSSRWSESLFMRHYISFVIEFQGNKRSFGSA